MRCENPLDSERPYWEHGYDLSYVCGYVSGVNVCNRFGFHHGPHYSWVRHLGGDTTLMAVWPSGRGDDPASILADLRRLEAELR